MRQETDQPWDGDSPVRTLGEESGEHWSLTVCLRNVAYTSAVNRQDNKYQTKEQRETALKTSVHCYCDILILSRTDPSQLLGFCNDAVDPSPIARDQFGSTARRSTLWRMNTRSDAEQSICSGGRATSVTS